MLGSSTYAVLFVGVGWGQYENCFTCRLFNVDRLQNYEILSFLDWVLKKGIFSAILGFELEWERCLAHLALERCPVVSTNLVHLRHLKLSLNPSLQTEIVRVLNATKAATTLNQRILV